MLWMRITVKVFHFSFLLKFFQFGNPPLLIQFYLCWFLFEDWFNFRFTEHLLFTFFCCYDLTPRADLSSQWLSVRLAPIEIDLDPRLHFLGEDCLPNRLNCVKSLQERAAFSAVD